MAGRALLELVKPDTPEGRVTRQLVVPIGTWHHPELGPYELSATRVQRFFDLYQQGVRQMNLPAPPAGPGGRGLMVSELHLLQGRAAGYLYDPELTERGIVASVFWTDAGLAGIQSGELCHLSPEFLPEFLDPISGQVFVDVWNGAGQVGRGFLDLPTIAIRFGDVQAGLVAFGDPEQLHMDEHEQADKVRNDPTEQPDNAAQGEAGAQPASPPAADAVGAPLVGAQAAGQAQGQPVQAFGDAQLSQRVVALETELAAERRGRLEAAYREELRTVNFGDPQQPMALSPAARDPLATELAQLEPDRARRILDAVKGARFYHPGVVGFDAPERLDEPAGPALLTAADRAAMAAAGLTEEQYRAGMNR